ncbi:MAG: hypothetical protein ABGZ17_29035, partial [Planctomycetaceae bacterium]
MLQSQDISMQVTHCARHACLVLCALALCGCGGETETDEAPPTDESQQKQDAGKSQPDASSATAQIRTDSDGRKWYDSVPLDVWYPDPLGKYNTPNPANSDLPP